MANDASTARPTAPAAKTTAAPAAKATAPAPAQPASTDPQEFDFGAVAIADATLPGITRRVEASVPDAMMDAMRASYDNKAGKAMTIPTAQVPRAVYLLRRAASDLGYGVRIVKGNAVDGKVTVQFQAKQKRAYTRKETASSTAPTA